MLELQQAVDVGEVELDTVFILIDGSCHGGEAHCRAAGFNRLGGEELSDELGIQRQRLIGKRGIIRCELWKGQGREVVVV